VPFIFFILARPRMKARFFSSFLVLLCALALCQAAPVPLTVDPLLCNSTILPLGCDLVGVLQPIGFLPSDQVVLTAGGNVAVSVSSAITIASLSFVTTGSTSLPLNILPGASLTVSGGVNLTTNTPISVYGSLVAGTVNVAGGTFLQTNNSITITGGLVLGSDTEFTVIGPGSASIGGQSSFVGTVTSNSGTLNLTAGTVTVDAASTVSATLNLQTGVTITTSSGSASVGGLSVSGTGNVLAPATGATLTVGGTPQVNAGGALTLTGNVVVSNNLGVSPTGAITIGNGTSNFQSGVTTTSGSTFTVGVGGNAILATTNNDLEGLTVLAGGVLNITGYATVASISVTGTATLQNEDNVNSYFPTLATSAGASLTFIGAATVQNTASLAGNVLFSSGSSFTFSGGVTAASTATLSLVASTVVVAGNGTFKGGLNVDAQSSLQFTSASAVTATFGGRAVVSGNLTLNANTAVALSTGVLTLATATAFAGGLSLQGNSNLTLQAGANTATTFNSAATTNAIIVASGATFTVSGATGLTGGIDFYGNALFSGSSTANSASLNVRSGLTTFAVFTSNAGSVVNVLGGATLAFTGANLAASGTYTLSPSSTLQLNSSSGSIGSVGVSATGSNATIVSAGGVTVSSINVGTSAGLRVLGSVTASATVLSGVISVGVSGSSAAVSFPNGLTFASSIGGLSLASGSSASIGGATTYTGTLTLASNSQLNVSASVSISGPVEVYSGGAISASTASGAVSFSSTVDLQGSLVASNGATFSVASGGTVTVYSTTNVGSQLHLQTGSSVVSGGSGAGVLSSYAATGSVNLGTSGSTIVIQGASTLSTGSTLTTNGNITHLSSSGVTASTITVQSGSLSYSSLTTDSQTTITLQSASLTTSGASGIAGTVTLQSGATLQLGNGASVGTVSVTGVAASTITAGSGTGLQVTSGITVGTQSSVNVAGNITAALATLHGSATVAAGATAVFSGGIQQDAGTTLALSSGSKVTVKASSALHAVSFTNATLTVSSGTTSVTGGNVDSGSAIDVASGASVLLSGTLGLSGSIVGQSGSTVLASTGTISIASGASINTAVALTGGAALSVSGPFTLTGVTVTGSNNNITTTQGTVTLSGTTTVNTNAQLGLAGAVLLPATTTVNGQLTFLPGATATVGTALATSSNANVVFQANSFVTFSNTSVNILGTAHLGAQSYFKAIAASSAYVSYLSVEGLNASLSTSHAAGFTVNNLNVTGGLIVTGNISVNTGYIQAGASIDVGSTSLDAVAAYFNAGELLSYGGSSFALHASATAVLTEASTIDVLQLDASTSFFLYDFLTVFTSITSGSHSALTIFEGGSLGFVATGTVNLAGTLQVGNITSPTVKSTSTATFTLDAGSGTTSVLSGGVNVGSYGFVNITTGTFVVPGAIHLYSGSLVQVNPGTNFTIAPGGQVTTQGDPNSTISVIGGVLGFTTQFSGAPSFLLTGSAILSAGAGSSVSAILSAGSQSSVQLLTLGALTIGGNSTINGTITSQANSVLTILSGTTTVAKNITASGLVQVQSALVFSGNSSGYTQQAGNLTLTNGAVSVNQLTVSSAATLSQTGTNSISGNVAVSGTSYNQGALNIKQSLDLGTNASVVFTITSDHVYGNINVNGNAQLNGFVSASFGPNYAPTVQTQYSVLTVQGNTNGAFTTSTSNYKTTNVIYNAHSTILEVNAGVTTGTSASVTTGATTTTTGTSAGSSLSAAVFTVVVAVFVAMVVA